MTMRYYRVNCYLPPAATGTKYGSNTLIGVAAESVETAIAAVKLLHPDARIDGVNDQGKIHNLSARESIVVPLAVAAKPE